MGWLPGERRGDHSLSVVIGGILLTWLLLYWHADPTTHLGAFYGNTAADWLDSFVEREMFGTAFRSALAEPGSAAADPDYRPPA